MMYLDMILGSKTKIDTLAVLVSNPHRTFIEVELAKESGSTVSEVNRQMRDLTTPGLVVMERIGKAKVYSINTKHFLYRPLKGLFRSLEETYRNLASEIVGFLTRRYKPRAVILFGSLAKGKIKSDLVKEPSDIDLLVVADRRDVDPLREAAVRFANEKISSKYGITVYPIVLSAESYLSGLRKDPFIMDVHARGEVLYGEKPRKFG